ncbi:MAG TPA: formylglycine-generating enzyme family protein [Phenylobacterium sp.]|jgi:formylglycine-generating enzyme required for sulfatase activity|nr:formylglycine-generating enzyme family protein [Phenylobacterium sp.]
MSSSGLAEPRPQGATRRSKFSGMRLVRGGEFLMGSEAFYPEERPLRTARVGDFWMDEHPVTNREFARFVDSTGYVTFAEIAPSAADYPGLSPEMARAGSAVFVPPSVAVDLKDPGQWWKYVFGADWRHPAGPESDIGSQADHPVVQIAYADALAYARWLGRDLPTEAEWEFAARGGLDGAAYAWGDDLTPGGQLMANYWHGQFPNENTLDDGFAGTSPVGAFPANGYGLSDMIGNVWEWTADWFGSATAEPAKACCGQPRARLATALESLDPATPHLRIPRKVLKGGSHLCADNYCRRYRPAARHAQAVDSPTSHIGFRCVVRRQA